MESMKERKRKADETRAMVAARDDYLSALKSYHALNDRSHDDPDLVQSREIMALAYKTYQKVCFGRDA